MVVTYFTTLPTDVSLTFFACGKLNNQRGRIENEKTSKAKETINSNFQTSFNKMPCYRQKNALTANGVRGQVGKMVSREGAESRV